jgi:hypothetical protein
MCTTERACAGIVKLELVFFWWLSFKHGRVGISRYLSYESAVVFHQKQLPCPSLPLSNNARQPRASSLLQLLLGAELVGVTALLLAAVGGTGRETSVALAADGLVAVVLGGKGLEGRLNDTTTEAEDQVEGRLLLDVVVRQGAAILELLSSEDETLLVRGNSLLVLDLALHIVDCVRGLDLKGDGLARQGLNEDLHLC